MNADPENAATEELPLVPAAAVDLPPPLPQDRTMRGIELALLIAVGFGGILYQTINLIVDGASPRDSRLYPWAYGLVHESTALALCAYLLHRQGRSFRNLGLSRSRLSDLGFALSLFLGQFLLVWMMQTLLVASGMYPTAVGTVHTSQIQTMIGTRFSLGMLGFIVINAFFEELLARAYLMSELVVLTRRVGFAVVVSSLFQGFYHLYQGWQAALQATVAFFFFSLFYARTRRILPVILAHMLWDLYTYAFYLIWAAYYSR